MGNRKKLRGRLQQGREIRRLQGLAKGQLRTGVVTLRDVLESPEDIFLTLPVHVVLECAPKLGKEGAKKAMQDVGLWPLDTLGTLTGQQRNDLLQHLPPRATRQWRRVKL